MLYPEYLSQPKFGNLEGFVENGGTILFTESNVLYAELVHNSVNWTITLVKGHN
ncbi:MAG: hypothetical protein P0116_06415 [Candidatus Nitrosocosmicus sp.]|nr:hypothetical protein [Candidatus Nitrosocosmicus sp.]